MKIAVTATGTTLESSVDPRFGRCPYFLVVETENASFEAVVNPNASRDSGAGIQAAQLLGDMGVQFVATGNCGPNAYQTLTAAQIGVIVGCTGSVLEVVENFKAGRYSTAPQANVVSHFGMGPAPTASTDPPSRPESQGNFAPGTGTALGQGGGFERGMGRGGGRAAGMGRGGGRGMGIGRGGGRGMGIGRGGGRGMGGGAGRGTSATDPPAGPRPEPAWRPQGDAVEQLEDLKARARVIEQQLAALNHQIEQTGQEPATPPLVAVLDVERCLGCGRCLQACPAGAITLSTVIAIDVGRCTGCGQCVVVCPQGAISLKARRDRVSSAGPGQADK